MLSACFALPLLQGALRLIVGRVIVIDLCGFGHFFTYWLGEGGICQYHWLHSLSSWSMIITMILVSPLISPPPTSCSGRPQCSPGTMGLVSSQNSRRDRSLKWSCVCIFDHDFFYSGRYIRMIFALRQFPQIIICFFIIMNIGVLVKMMMIIVTKISKITIISHKQSTDVCQMLLMIMKYPRWLAISCGRFSCNRTSFIIVMMIMIIIIR